jgi:hypothetical protein
MLKRINILDEYLRGGILISTTNVHQAYIFLKYAARRNIFENI